MSVKFVLLYLCHSHAFFFFFSRKQGNNERVLLESLKSKYKNILLGFKELKQMKQEQAQKEKATRHQEKGSKTAARGPPTNGISRYRSLRNGVSFNL